MCSLRALRIVGIGLAFAAILASGGLPVGSQSGQQTPQAFYVTFSYPDSTATFIDLFFSPDGQKVTNHSLKTISVPQGPSWVAIHPKAPFSYLVSWDAKALTVLDNLRREAVKAISLSGNPYALAFRPDGAVAYVIDAEHKRISVVNASDPANPFISMPIVLPEARAPRGLAFSPDGQKAFVSDTETDTLWVLDALQHRVQATLHTGGQCGAFVKASNNGQWVYVADRCLSRVYALEAATVGSATPAITPIQLSGNSGAWFILFVLQDKFALVSQTDPRRNISSGKISVIDVAQKKEISTIDLNQIRSGLGASALAYSAAAVVAWPAGLTDLDDEGRRGGVQYHFAPGSTAVIVTDRGDPTRIIGFLVMPQPQPVLPQPVLPQPMAIEVEIVLIPEPPQVPFMGDGRWGDR